ncbi:hypothetical protein EJ03DRAFT_143113 [Teratosphaeria nubilosa]|uniref:Uncharacterized protein n=1 Tax=Teratosphaeria nubilosa TaxID=161662 RepID=A0A6G1L5B5_9PEZI|nr:hypothetical protein EJ03DRAFT_143113 [Teratosphaeria nubilosa]
MTSASPGFDSRPMHNRAYFCLFLPTQRHTAFEGRLDTTRLLHSINISPALNAVMMASLLLFCCGRILEFRC